MSRRAITAVATPGTAALVKPLEIAGGTLEAMKWIALLLMTGDHVNKYLLNDSVPALFQAGRIAMPLFVFVLAYNAARPGFFTSGAAGRTCLRLAGYGLAAHVPYMALGKVLGGWWPLNIMLTLLASLALLWAVQKHKTSSWMALCIFTIGGSLVEYWWPALVLTMAAWRYALKPTTGRMAVLALALGALALINQNFWALAALPIILAAPHLDLRVPRVRSAFYVYYPAHLAVIWLITYLR